jgi:membrane-bound lytic murein transglycosylase D
MTMPCSISKKSARHLSILLPILLAAGCSENARKDDSANQSSSKFSVFTHNASQGNKLHLAGRGERGEHTTVWDRMQALYALPEVDNARIDREINWFLKNPEYLARVQQRAEPFMHFILNELEAKNLPGELALLPVIESAFNPDAQSPAQASGIWQFIPPTGRLYGLKQNGWYDGRRDVVESTQAATAFLKQLSNNFNNDWLLALASYNAGPGNIRNAIDRNQDKGRPTDFWSLDLNNETSSYVPKLLAVAKIFGNPEKYNVNLQHIPDRPYFEQVDVNSQLNLHKAAEMAETPVNHFLHLNPGFNRKTTHPDGSNRLLIPVSKANAFKEKLAELPKDERQNGPTERVKWQYHTVASSDSLEGIAQQYGTTADEIIAVNHLDDARVAEGKILLIPSAYSDQDNDNGGNVAERSHSPHAAVIARAQSYTVKKGDTLSSVAAHFSVDKSDIISWNKLSGKAPLKPGQKITLKKTEATTAAASGKHGSESAAAKTTVYTTKPGDTLGQISKKFNVSVIDLRRWNNVPKNKADVKPGSRLKING